MASDYLIDMDKMQNYTGDQTMPYAWFYLLRKPNKKGTKWIHRFGQSEQERPSSRVSAHRSTGFEFTDYIIIRTKKGDSKRCEDWFKMYIEGLAYDYTDDTQWYKGYNYTIDWWTHLPETVKIKWGKSRKDFSFFTTPIDVDFVSDVDGHRNTLVHCFSAFHNQDEYGYTKQAVKWQPYKKGTRYKIQVGNFNG